MSLHINMTSGSQHLSDSSIAQAITALAVAVKKQEGQVPSSPSIEITFMLPGKEDKPNFSGMRMVRYDSTPNTLSFERAVPERILHSADSYQFVALVLQDMVDNARTYYMGTGESFDYPCWQKLADSMGAKLFQPG